MWCVDTPICRKLDDAGRLDHSGRMIVGFLNERDPMIAQGASARMARLVLSTKSEQRSLFGRGVSEADGWEVILTLFVADAEGQRFTVGQVIDKVDGEAEATRRRISHLSHAGVIVGDGSGRIGDVVTLAPEALTNVEILLERAWAAIGTL